MANFLCPICHAECYSARLLQRHLDVTSCGAGRKAGKTKAQLPLVEALPLALKELPPPTNQPEHTGTHPIFQWTCDDYMCWCHKPTCKARLFRKGGSWCNCGNDWKSPLLDPLPQPTQPLEPWPDVEVLGPLSFATLVDRLADYYHRLNSESAVAEPSVKQISRMTDIHLSRVRSILVSRSAPDVTCLEGDRLLRGLGISLVNLLVKSDQLPAVDHKAAITKALGEIEVQLGVALYAVEDSREVTTYLQGVLKARIGAIAEQVDAIHASILRPEDIAKRPGDGLPVRRRGDYEADLTRRKKRRKPDDRIKL